MNSIELSVVLPCRNEELYIEDCIRSVHQAILFAELEGRAEIIVVDGKSIDGTLTKLSQLTVNYPCLKTINNNMITTPHAFNFGISSSRGEIISILGVHWQIEKDYFKKLLNVLSSTEADIVGGAIIAKGGSGLTSRIIARAMQNPVGTGLGMRSKPGEAPPQPLPADTVPGGVFKRKVYDTTGPFNPALIRNQDDEWMARARNAGFRIFQDTSVKTSYYCRNSLTALAKQYFQYGYYKVYTLLPEFHFSIRQVLSCGLILYLLTGLIMLFLPWAWKIGLGAIIIYPIIISLQTILTMGENRGLVLNLLSISATMIMQISYGAGICLGIIRWNTHPANSRNAIYVKRHQ